VRDAHDRYANVETGFLLQRLEMHDGLVILASNLRQNLDDAFLRRIGVVAEFPVPGPAERKEIWQRLMPPDHVDADVDVDFLARTFTLSGGEIRNAMLTAAFLAADGDSHVGMAQLCVGIHRELQKSGRLVDPNTFGAYQTAIQAWLAGGPTPGRGRA
jgi:SpoVK/Ycf46/Vps4 family AAA+-type ATPase